jgi:hypothetical protein
VRRGHLVTSYPLGDSGGPARGQGRPPDAEPVPPFTGGLT